MLQNDVAQAGRFTSKSAGHYNRLTLRNGVSLNGLTRNPLEHRCCTCHRESCS